MNILNKLFESSIGESYAEDFVVKNQKFQSRPKQLVLYIKKSKFDAISPSEYEETNKSYIFKDEFRGTLGIAWTLNVNKREIEFDGEIYYPTYCQAGDKFFGYIPYYVSNKECSGLLNTAKDIYNKIINKLK